MTADVGVLDLHIEKGVTYTKVLRWETSTVVFRPITEISRAAPPVVTAAAHGLPDGWRAAIGGVKGMTQINSVEYQKTRLLTANTVELSKVDAASYSAYVSGGTLRYNQPADLAGYISRLLILDPAGATILALTTENDRIWLNNTLKTITLVLTAAVTAGLTWTAGVYDGLDMESPGGVVTRLVEGSVTRS